jgi:hypothetical protein
MMIALMMEAVNTSTTPINFYQTTLRNIPEAAVFSLIVLISSNHFVK